MARYDLHEDGDRYLLDVQDNYLDGLNTRVVVPLLPRDRGIVVAPALNPIFRIDSVEYVMETQFLAAVPQAALGRKRGDLTDRFDEITRALDVLLHGF